jgi:uncharacterized membrane protein
MTPVSVSPSTCLVCGKSFGPEDLTQGASVRSVIGDLIRRDHAGWSSASRICRDDLSRYSMQYLEALLQLDQGELTDLGREAVKSLQQHGLLAANVEAAFEKDLTIGQRLSDGLIRFGGHRGVVSGCLAVMIASVLTGGALLYWQPAHPYPFVLMNLLFDCAILVLAPIVALSQAPHSAKDRLRWEHSYLMNLKAELGLRQVRQALDGLVDHQRQRLVEIQQTLLLLISRPGRPEAPQAQAQPRSIKSA